MADFSIVFPAYNEATVIIDTVRSYVDYFGDRAELIIIDNGSEDGTQKLIEQNFRDDARVKYFYFDHPLGKGGAVYEGFKHASSDLLGFTDTDESVPADQFDR
ncbi:glycosyltransferase family 2 protein, partial [candidate division WWE3 bacterium]|nr:glycosyltransferase family 2 protein [candidate division WWE3 bacterium]